MSCTADGPSAALVLNKAQEA